MTIQTSFYIANFKSKVLFSVFQVSVDRELKKKKKKT